MNIFYLTEVRYNSHFKIFPVSSESKSSQDLCQFIFFSLEGEFHFPGFFVCLYGYFGNPGHSKH